MFSFCQKYVLLISSIIFCLHNVNKIRNGFVVGQLIFEENCSTLENWVQEMSPKWETIELLKFANVAETFLMRFVCEEIIPFHLIRMGFEYMLSKWDKNTVVDKPTFNSSPSRSIPGHFLQPSRIKTNPFTKFEDYLPFIKISGLSSLPYLLKPPPPAWHPELLVVTKLQWM